MFLYTVLEAIAAVIAGILIAVRTKKPEHVTYNKLDKAGKVTNILLSILYIATSYIYLFLGMISGSGEEGFLGIIGWIISIVIASASIFCWLGIGFSVAWRKKGKSKQSFAVQFAGVFGIALSIILYVVFAGNLVSSLN